MSTVLDYAAGPPSAASIKAAGHVGVVRYLSEARPEIKSWATGKPVKKSEIMDFGDNKLLVAFVWQYGKVEDADVRRGYDGGVADAKAAQAKLEELGMPDRPVYFAVDYDMSIDEWRSFGAAYFRGAAQHLGKQRVGIYGHSRVCHWAGPEDDLVARVDNTHWLCWVTKGHSNGETGEGYAVLYQRVVDTKANPGPVVGGVVVDVNDVLHPEWGWRALPDKEKPSKENKPVSSINKNPGQRGDPVWLPEVLRAFGVTVKEMDGWRNWGMGDFGSIWGVVVHHTAANNTSPEYVARNPGISNALSSQIHLDREGVVTLLGAGIAWHAGAGSYPGIQNNAANQVTIGIEAQSDGVSPWPEEELDAYYRICAAICWYLNLPSSRVIAHYEWSSGGKWDPGAGTGISGARMDMNNFRRRVQDYIDNPPFNQEEGLFMSLSHERQEELGAKIDRIHHELTHRFQSRYVDPETNKRSAFHETLIGYALEGDKKAEAVSADMLPAIWDAIADIRSTLATQVIKEKK